MKIYLASKSKARRFLLEKLLIPYEIIETSAEEKNAALLQRLQNSPEEYVITAAELKLKDAQKIYKQKIKKENPPNEEYIIIAADTMIYFQNHLLGKPKNAEHALEMLKTLNGKTHHVYTGVCLYSSKEAQVIKKVVKSTVTFFKHEERLLKHYVETGEPLTRAGAYEAQSGGSFLVKKVDGSFSNVIGLPIEEILPFILEKMGKRK